LQDLAHKTTAEAKTVIGTAVANEQCTTVSNAVLARRLAYYYLFNKQQLQQDTQANRPEESRVAAAYGRLFD